MKKSILFIILVTMAISGASAQNIFFPVKEGMTLVYANLNSKGKADSYTRQTIQKVEGAGDNLTVSYLALPLDNNRRPLITSGITYTVSIVNGIVEWDMKSYAAPGTIGAIEIEGDKLRIPPTLVPGVKLDDVSFTLTVNLGFKIKTAILLSDQECLAIEDITVPAGTFKCYKVTQTSNATIGRRTAETKSINWYAPGIGTVKTESYDAKGKLQSGTELQSVEN